MKIIQNLKDFPYIDEVFLSIGNFDGLHLGHQKIINELKLKAKNKPTFVITFKKAPMQILNQENFKGYIFPYNYKEKIFNEIGIDYLANLDFMEIMNLKKDEFISFLKQKFKKINIFIGYNFKFGKDNEGDVEFLKKEIPDTYVIDKVSINGERISSSKIRELIAEGKIEEANKMLGRYYFISSEEIKGDGLGRKLGFPTINLKINEQVLPQKGIYFTLYKLEEKIFPAMTYIGKRPTVNGNEIRNETNIINLDEKSLQKITNIKKHTIYFIKKTREEKKLNNLEELKNLLYNDREVILSLFKAIGGFKDEFYYRS